VTIAIVFKDSILTLSQFVKRRNSMLLIGGKEEDCAKTDRREIVGFPRKKCLQLASPISTPYTEFAAILSAGQRKKAAERACPLRQPGLTRVISFASFIH